MSGGDPEGPGGEASFRIAEILFDEGTNLAPGPEAEHERAIAIFDLLEENFFRPEGSGGGPYKLILGLEENRLVFDIRLFDDTGHGRLLLSMTPFRRIVRDYFMICESYYEAIRHASAQQIEAIDMGRRGLHNEGSEILRERLAGKVDVDFSTARRLFTLLCSLHLKS
ncbi:MAG: UPF0262 family protein [Alphaproteobacteria bacterium]